MKELMNRAAIVVAICGASVGALAQPSYDLTTSTTWDVSNRGGIMKGGAFNALTRAFGHDRHGGPAIDGDGAVRGIIGKNKPVTKVKKPDKFKSGLDHRKAVKAGLHKFQQQDIGHEDGDVSPVLYNQNRKITNKPTHPTAVANQSIIVNPAYKVGTKHFMDAVMSASGSAKLSPLEGGNNIETAYAEAISYSQLRLHGLIERGNWNDKVNPKKGGKIKKGGKSVDINGKSSDTDTEKPPKKRKKRMAGADVSMELEFFDQGTQTTLAREVLYAESWYAEDEASISWNDMDGFRLEADLATGVTGLEFSTLSSWVTNPSAGSVSITNGVFLATGDLAVMPWDVFELDGELIATLVASEFTPGGDIDYDASSLGDSVGDIRATLMNNTEAFASDYATIIPSPGSLALLGMGMGFASRRRRRS